MDLDNISFDSLLSIASGRLKSNDMKQIISELDEVDNKQNENISINLSHKKIRYEENQICAESIKPEL